MNGNRASSSPGLLRLCATAALAISGSVFVPSTVLAQSNVDGYVYGQVTGTSPGNVQVRLKSLETGVTKSVSVDGEGRYRLPNVPPGSYEITAERDGTVVSRTGVVVTLGAGIRADLSVQGDVTVLDSIEVTSTGIAPVEVTKTEASLTITRDKIESMPVGRSVTSVALLAPGAVEGDAAFNSDAFGNLASFGGASVGENAYYFNGFNITNFRTGVGYSDIPFAFFNQFEVKTGGYGAEFGRSLGGVVNTTSQRGTNQWQAGVSMYWEPEELSARAPQSRYPSGNVRIDNSQDEVDQRSTNIYAGGAIIPNKLFVYGLVELRNNATTAISAAYPDTGGAVSQTLRQTSEDAPFYGAKVDYYPLEGHHLEFTYFRNRNVVNRNFVVTSAGGAVSPQLPETFTSGGETFIGRYTVDITDNFSLSALLGQGELTEDRESLAPGLPWAQDRDGGGRVPLTDQTITIGDINRDRRRAARLDLEYRLYGHVIRGGIDYERNQSTNQDVSTGGGSYVYFGVDGLGLGSGRVEGFIQEYAQAGTSDTTLTALYLEDTWSITDRLSVYAGLRNETFENKNQFGDTYAELKDQWAPRVGISWDFLGDGRSKAYATAGRYYMPIASNTNARAASGEVFVLTYFSADGWNGDGTPTNMTVEEVENLSSPVLPGNQFLSQNLDPMYQDELILGVQAEVTKGWLAGARLIFRELGTQIEDFDLCPYILDRYPGDTDNVCNQFGYVGAIWNPGRSWTGEYDPDFDGPMDPVSISFSADELGFPKAKRKYNAVELTLENFGQKYYVQGSYTWSQSYGNLEGFVNSDVGQDDGGITQSFDYVALTEGSYGYLPNDRRHKFKLYGYYDVTEQLRVGANASAYSGRPISAFGVHPTDDHAQGYQNSSFYNNGVLVPRGTAGETPWLYNVDLSVAYTPSLFEQRLTLGLDIFNVFNFDAKTSVLETAQVASSAPGAPAEPGYKTALTYQTPRYARLSLNYRF